jgi:hypothetical protein
MRSIWVLPELVGKGDGHPSIHCWYRIPQTLEHVRGPRPEAMANTRDDLYEETPFPSISERH